MNPEEALRAVERSLNMIEGYLERGNDTLAYREVQDALATIEIVDWVSATEPGPLVG